MADLITSPNMPDPDGFYADLIKTYEAIGDDKAVSAFSARLILLLTNHIGDRDVISQAVAAAANTSIKA
jgi:hypothetical protein